MAGVDGVKLEQLDSKEKWKFLVDTIYSGNAPSCKALEFLYQKSGVVFRVKWNIAYVVVWLMKKRKKPTFRHNCRTKDVRQIGVACSEDLWKAELPQPLTKHTNDADTLGFWGTDNHSNTVIARITRRHDRTSEVMIYLKLASGDEYQLPIQPGVQVVNTDGKSFSASGLTFELLEPMRRWRISFNGLLKKSIDRTWSNCNEVLPVRFNFIWFPIYCYMAIPDDVNVALFADCVARMNWTYQFIRTSFRLPEDWYEQCGELLGTVNIDDGEESTLLLRGHKDRKHGIQDWSLPERGISIRGYLKNGDFFHVCGVEKLCGIENFIHGYVNPASNLSVNTINHCSLKVRAAEESVQNHQDVFLRFTAGDSEFLLLAKESGFGFSAFMGNNWEQNITFRLVTLQLNDIDGFGVVEYRKPHEGICQAPKNVSVPLLAEPEINETAKLVVNFEDLECRSSKIVGGKGASLGLLSALASNRTEQFVVPAGLCITNEAFQQHLGQNPTVKTAIHSLEAVAWKRKVGSISAECTKVMEAMLCTKVSRSLQESIDAQMKAKFPDLIDMPFAIRSSALGEDSEELSAAGQNETYLGVRSFHEILKAIVKCWASLFSFRSVEYRRQYGQLINSGMGVVMQLMVPCDVAGVIFSHDPRTGSPAFMTITSNYGLGESVVAAAADPDTIILKRTWDEEVHVHHKDIGKKNLKIIMSESGGTVESTIGPEDSSKCTLSDELCIKLGKLTIYLEQCFGNARDNEWAVFNDQIFLLQSRPVTSDSVLTDFQVLHEFETPFRTDDERFTTANIQEVMPGAMTPLTLSGPIRAMSVGFFILQRGSLFGSRFDPTALDSMVLFQNHAMFDRIQQKIWNSGEEKTGSAKAMELGFFGRVLDDESTVAIAKERYRKPSLYQRYMMLSFTITGVAIGPWLIKKVERMFRNHSIPMGDLLTPRAAYDRIEEHLMNIQDVVNPHMSVTMASTVWNLFLLNILSKGSGEFNMDHYADFALLIGSNNGTESGHIPFQLQDLARAISQKIDGRVFASMPPDLSLAIHGLQIHIEHTLYRFEWHPIQVNGFKIIEKTYRNRTRKHLVLWGQAVYENTAGNEAMKWLCEKGENLLEIFDDFRKRHGHRAFKEFEMRTVTWGMEPLLLVVALQNILKHENAFVLEHESNRPTIQASIAEMKTPISGLQRKILALVMRLCRTYVCYREHAKSMMINFQHSLRKSYRHLAKLMVNSGLLPDEDLMYFLTHEEIGQLIDTRSPRLIRRAKRRFHHYAYMDSLHFPEMIDGYPKPIEEMTIDTTDLEGIAQVKGYPACSGVVQGVARVITTFDDAPLIASGEILITYSTDIGWSPYFPLLSGVVTEIGGLISHGAVVAREYGLPCLIGAENATKIFKSGDVVKLDACKGILSKVGS